MDIVGDRSYVEVFGDRIHELPPLLLRDSPPTDRLAKVMKMAGEIVETEEMLPFAVVEDPFVEAELARRRLDLAVNLVDHYQLIIKHWLWGDSVIQWIRQCETTFETCSELHHLLKADLWPHAGRSSFVTLLEDKEIKTEGVELHRAVGLRLAFRQPPPMRCFSNQFLFYLNQTCALTAYETWSSMAPDPVSSLPPERFSFEVVNMNLSLD